MRPRFGALVLVIFVLGVNSGFAFSREPWASTPELDALTKWATSRGAVLNGIALASIPGRGNGVVATRRIAEGEEVLSVPASLFFTADTMPQASAIHASLRSMDAGSNQLMHLSTALGLLALNASRSRGPWLPYLDVLPDPTPVSEFSDAEIDAFKHAQLAQQARAQRAAVRTMHARMEPVLKLMLGRAVTLRDFIRAHTLVSSRAHNVTDPASGRLPPGVSAAAALIPVADMFNHGIPRSLHQHYRYDARVNAFRVWAAEAYVPGQEVLLCYGLRANAAMALHYGAVLPRNPVDRLTLSASPHADAPLRDRRLHLLTHAGVGTSVGIMPLAPLPPGAATAFLVGRLTPRQLAAAERLVAAGVPLCDFDPLDAAPDALSPDHRTGSVAVAADGTVQDAARPRDEASYRAYAHRLELPALCAHGRLDAAAEARLAASLSSADLAAARAVRGVSGGSAEEAAAGRRGACAVVDAAATHFRPQCAYLWHALEHPELLAKDAADVANAPPPPAWPHLAEEDMDMDEDAGSGAGAGADRGSGARTPVVRSPRRGPSGLVRPDPGHERTLLPAAYTDPERWQEVLAAELQPTRPAAPGMVEAHVRVVAMCLRFVADRDATLAEEEAAAARAETSMRRAPSAAAAERARRAHMALVLRASLAFVLYTRYAHSVAYLRRFHALFATTHGVPGPSPAGPPPHPVALLHHFFGLDTGPGDGASAPDGFDFAPLTAVPAAFLRYLDAGPGAELRAEEAARTVRHPAARRAARASTHAQPRSQRPARPATAGNAAPAPREPRDRAGPRRAGSWRQALEMDE